MTRHEEIAAALSAWEIETAQGYDLPSMPSVIAVGDALARLLRAANPPINSESSPEPATPAVREDDLIATWKTRSMGLYGNDGLWVKEAGDALATRLRALLADVARLEEQLTAARNALPALLSIAEAAEAYVSMVEQMPDASLGHEGNLRKVRDGYDAVCAALAVVRKEGKGE